MICKNCGASNPDDALYCSSCGAKLAEQDLPLYGGGEAPAQNTPAQNTSAQSAPTAQGPYQQQSAPVFPTYGAGETKSTPNPYAGNYTGYTNGAPLTGDSTRDWAGTAALICGIASLPCCFTAVGGFVLGILGVVFGVMGLKSNKRGLALAGLITGAVGFICSAFMIVAVAVAMKDPTFMEEFMSEYESSMRL